MSIVTYKRTIIPAVWPGELGRASSGTFDLQVDDSWRYVPETFKGICGWATVAKDDEEDATWGQRHLVYRPSVLPDDMRKTAQVVVVVLQGFLGDCNVTPLGDWDKDRAPSSAMQYLTLEAGGAAEPFAAQVAALRNLCDFISAKVGVELEEAQDSETSILLQRPVFTKVRSPETQAPAVRLGKVSDPGGRAMRLSSQWRVDHIVTTGTRLHDGSNMEIAATSLRRGDFVEVSIFADVQLVRRRQRTGTIIKFAMREVVRLWTAADARRRFQRTDDVVEEEAPRLPKTIVVPSVFQIGAQDGDDGVLSIE